MFSIDWKLFTSTYGLIFLAEIPDKTALIVVMMATRCAPLAVFTGAAVAFLLQSAVAIALGGVLGFLPAHWVHMGAALMFLLFAFHSWRKSEEDSDVDRHATPIGRGFWNDMAKVFLVIFVAEWGDLTQLASASLVARYREPWTVFCGSTLALWSVTAIGSGLGARLKFLVRPALLNKIAAAVFAAVGCYLLVS